MRIENCIPLMKDRIALLLVVVTSLSWAPATEAKDPIRIVSSLTIYGDIAKEIVGEQGVVESIASARQDAHFVQAKPSYSMMLSKADLLLTTGLDLELWIPAVIDKSRNRRIREGEPGYVSVATGVPMLEVPDNPSRAGGDIHIYGNPHIHTDPLRAVIVAQNIKTGLQNVDPDNSGHYEERFRDFKRRIHERLFGPELVELVGGDKLGDLEMKHALGDFLETTQVGGQPLLAKLGGWMKQAECFRGKKIVAYHLNWIYFTDRFGIEIAAYVERRPGIPPSAAHVAELIELIRREKIQVLWAADYFDARIPNLIAEKTGAKARIVPLYTGDTPSTADYFSLIDTWIRTLRASFSDCSD